MDSCTLCPRRCKSDRGGDRLGFCGESKKMTVSRASLHMWEEPPISGTRGSGTIFFCGCNLRCVFCQNKAISRGGGVRYELSCDELCRLMLRLQDLGAHNINLVTPTHFADSLATCLEKVRPKLGIPIVYNSSGYENISTLKMLDGLVDIYLPDFKYASSRIASDYSNAPDYPEVASAAIAEMFRQTGAVSFDGDGMMQKGVIVRHLILPACRHDSIALLDVLSTLVPVKDIRLSLMSQYTPDFALDCEFKNLQRRLTSFEYNSVLSHAIGLGFEGYFQELSSSSQKYTPDFEEECEILKDLRCKSLIKSIEK